MCVCVCVFIFFILFFFFFFCGSRDQGCRLYEYLFSVFFIQMNICMQDERFQWRQDRSTEHHANSIKHFMTN